MTTPLTLRLYGIPHCDTVKKSRAWFASQGLAVEFHDFKKLGVPLDRLEHWCKSAGWDKLLNRQGTTWRKLPPQVQSGVRDTASALQLLQEWPSAIKRPVVECHSGETCRITVGFAPEVWAAWAAE